MELRLSDERIHNLEALLVHWDQRKRCRKRELLSLIGKLAHASTVVRVGRIFLRRLINLSTQAARLHHWLHLSMEARADIAWWKTFLEAWNHRSMMCMADPPAPDIIFSSDASGTWGCGASWGKAWNSPRNGVRYLLRQKSWSQSYWLARYGGSSGRY